MIVLSFPLQLFVVYERVTMIVRVVVTWMRRIQVGCVLSWLIFWALFFYWSLFFPLTTVRSLQLQTCQWQSARLWNEWGVSEWMRLIRFSSFSFSFYHRQVAINVRMRSIVGCGLPGSALALESRFRAKDLETSHLETTTTLLNQNPLASYFLSCDRLQSSIEQII